MAEQPSLATADIVADARRLRRLLRETQNYVCGNHDSWESIKLCGAIAEAMHATMYLRDDPSSSTGQALSSEAAKPLASCGPDGKEIS